MGDREDKFAEIALKDALDGIGKAAGARIGAVGILTTLMLGSITLAANSRAYIFLCLGLVFAVVLVVIDSIQRAAILGYLYRYFEISNFFYAQRGTYTWLSAFTPPTLLEELQDLATNGEYSDQERSSKLREICKPLRRPSITMIFAVVVALFVVAIVGASAYAGWPLLPLEQARK